MTKIFIAIILGFLVAFLFPDVTPYLSIFGEIFIKALKAVAPILVFILVISSITNFETGQSAKNIKPIIALYVISMLLAAFSAVIADLLFPTTLVLASHGDQAFQPPGSLSDVLKT